MKRILLLTTGGTIASVKTENGLAPGTSGEEILSYIPEAKKYCRMEVCQIFSLDSTNLQPEHWLKIAGKIRESYEKFDGFVITHGTDTMAYTAAALSYLIQNPEKPVILTGAQKPISAPITDARKNLLDSINYPVAAFIDDRRILQYVEAEEEPVPVRFYDQIDPGVFLLKLIPGMEPDILRYIGSRYDAIIIESYGVGGIPFYDRRNFLEELARLTRDGKIVVIATQVMLEGSDAEVYEVGFKAVNEYNVLQAYDMTVEAAAVKLMWILGMTRDFARVRELFYRPVSHDIVSMEE